MRERIAGYTDAVVDGADAAARRLIASDVAAILQLLSRAEDLSGALSDPGVPAPQRRGVLTDLLRGRVDQRSLNLVAFASDADRAMEFVADLEWLAARTAAARDDLHALESGPLGRTAAGERMDGYATAVLESVDGNALGELEDELFRFTRIVAGSPELSAALLDRDVPIPVRRSIVADLLGAKATPATNRLAGYAAGTGRARDYLRLLEEVLERVASEGNRRVAEVRAYLPFDDDERQRLAATLKRLTGRDVEIRVTVDRSVLGGFVATVGDTVVDGSARHRLELLKERLLLPEATMTSEPTTDNPGESA